MSYANDQYASVENNFVCRQYGSSLLEVLISLTVLSFAFTSLVSFQAILFYNSNQAKLRTDAVAIADAKLEEFRHFNNIALFDAISSGSETIGPKNSGAAIELSGLKAMFTRKWSVTNTNTHKVIAVTVTWPGSRRDLAAFRQVSLNTTLARLDPGQSVIGTKTL